MLFRFKPLKYEDTGKRVTEAQQMLRKAGSSITVNGEYSFGMENAVRSFQKKNGLTPTGIIDRKTFKKLKQVTKGL